MTKEQPSVVVADSKWAANLIEESFETNPQHAAQVSPIVFPVKAARHLPTLTQLRLFQQVKLFAAYPTGHEMQDSL